MVHSLEQLEGLLVQLAEIVRRHLVRQLARTRVLCRVRCQLILRHGAVIRYSIRILYLLHLLGCRLVVSPILLLTSNHFNLFLNLKIIAIETILQHHKVNLFDYHPIVYINSMKFIRNSIIFSI